MLEDSPVPHRAECFSLMKIFHEAWGRCQGKPNDWSIKRKKRESAMLWILALVCCGCRNEVLINLNISFPAALQQVNITFKESKHFQGTKAPYYRTWASLCLCECSKWSMSHVSLWVTHRGKSAYLKSQGWILHLNWAHRDLSPRWMVYKGFNTKINLYLSRMFSVWV